MLKIDRVCFERGGKRGEDESKGGGRGKRATEPEGLRGQCVWYAMLRIEAHKKHFTHEHCSV